MIVKFIYIFLLSILIFSLMFLLVIPFCFLLKFSLENLSNINWLLTKPAWTEAVEVLAKKMPFFANASILGGIMSGVATVIVYLLDRSIVPDLRTRCIGLGILAVFMASLFFLAKYYGLIPLKKAIA